jgi:hypothetical protein
MNYGPMDRYGHHERDSRQPCRDVGTEHGQVCVGSRYEHLADSQVKLVLGQPSLRERRLNHVDHQLAVCGRSRQAAAVRARCCLIFGP